MRSPLPWPLILAGVGDREIAQITKKQSIYVSVAITRIIKMYDLRKSYVFMIRMIVAET